MSFLLVWMFNILCLSCYSRSLKKQHADKVNMPFYLHVWNTHPELPPLLEVDQFKKVRGMLWDQPDNKDLDPFIRSQLKTMPFFQEEFDIDSAVQADAILGMYLCTILFFTIYHVIIRLFMFH